MKSDIPGGVHGLSRGLPGPPRCVWCQPPRAGRTTHELAGRGPRRENLSYSLVNSEAWRTLRGAAVKVFLELRTRFHGGNNGKLHMSLEEAARLLRLGKATVLR